VRRGLSPSEDAAGLAVASRTDRGVSARANALVFESDLPAPAVLRSLNGIAPSMFFTGIAEVPSTFRVRGARRRHYRYFEREVHPDLDLWRAGAARFVGEVDVRSFGRGLPAAEPCVRTLESVRLTEEPGGLVIDVLAPSFVWGMVRKIIAALREVGAGRLSVARLSRALAGEERLTLPLAEPERLVLWEVEYELPWEQPWVGPNAHQKRWWDEALAASEARCQILEALRGGADFGSGDVNPPVPSARASAPR
jgi:tRNA pseudouridine38-40 synthase